MNDREDMGWTVCDECDTSIPDDQMKWYHCVRPKEWWESIHGSGVREEWPWFICTSCHEDIQEQTDQTKEVKNVTE